jgi:excisionase family DNA binding protein
VSTETVLRWTRRGDLPGIRLPGGAVRFRPDAIQDWIVAQETNPGISGKRGEPSLPAAICR